MSQKLGAKKTAGIYDYDYLLDNLYSLLKRDLSEKNFELVKKYDMEMVNSSLSKATRHKNLKMILGLSRLLRKDWVDVTKQDIEELVWKIMN